MIDILKFFLPVFSTAKNYEDVLKRLAGFVFWEIYVTSFFFRSLSPIADALKAVEGYGALGTAISAIPLATSLNISGFAIALLVAWATYVGQLHNRLSDILGIRRRFDRDHILIPLARNTGIELMAAESFDMQRRFFERLIR